MKKLDLVKLINDNEIGLKNIIPNIASIMPKMMETYTVKEKIPLAFSFSPSPKVLEINALPPAPSIKPIAPSIIKTGIIKLTDLNSSSPAKFETKNPSTTPYMDEKTIIIIEGSVNLMSFL